MNIKILGTGDATGMPVPLCDCDYCIESDRRRPPGIIVSTEETTVLFDLGPDISEKLSRTDIMSIDAAFLTHAHGDHSAGLPRLYQAAKWDANHLESIDKFRPAPEGTDPDYPIYLTKTAKDHLSKDYGFLEQRLNLNLISNLDQVTVNDVSVDSFPVEHHRPEFDTLGFVIESKSDTVAYAPDMRKLVGPFLETNVDLLVCEGAAIFGQPVHGPRKELIRAIDEIDAERTVLVNINEHIQQSHTEELRETAHEEGYELAEDLELISI